MDREQLLVKIFQAYYDARRNKRNTINQIQFEIEYEKSLIELCDEVVNRTYKIRPSICFVVDKPVKREIFAADFRDRVIHHLLFNLINPYIDSMFIEDSYSCRKGKGTLYGIRRVQNFIKECSNNYTQDCYILKIDIRGYFMSINKKIMYSILEDMYALSYYHMNEEEKNDFDLEMVVYLTKVVLDDDPRTNCQIRGSRSDWDGMPPSKSMFNSPDGYGLPIGNLTSQLFSNVYLHKFDDYIKNEICTSYYGRYVDDAIFIHKDKNVLKNLLSQSRKFLKEHLELDIHPLKIYLQHYTKGVTFLGATIKPHRSYISNRTKTNFLNCINYWNKRVLQSELTKNELLKMRSSINSYLGIMCQHFSYNIRKKALLNRPAPLLKYGYLNNGLKQFTIRKSILRKYFPIPYQTDDLYEKE